MTTPALQTGHVALNVTDLARSTAFYRQVFGFDTLAEQTDGERRFAFLGRDGSLILTLWQQSGGAFPADRPGLHHLSFQVPDIEAVRRHEAVLRDLGVRFAYDGVVPHGEGASSGGVFFTDPDGIRLEIYAPTGAETAAAPVQGAPTCGFF
ncbi:VOC family protein [Nonomuraea bangladeshensis]|uniref:VOC family protein n=1 Tax=Nonomuraea bangladeshensis TaxID=404385 RepID=UPI0031DC548B